MSHIKDRLIQLKNEVENTGNGAYLSKNNISKIVELLLADLEQDEKENGWIPVSERLPEESDYYMACIHDEILNKYYCRSEWLSINNNYYGELVWIDLKSYEKVVAWMPLPNPMKEDDV